VAQDYAADVAALILSESDDLSENQADHHSQTESTRPRPLLSPNHAGPTVVHRRCAALTRLVERWLRHCYRSC